MTFDLTAVIRLRDDISGKMKRITGQTKQMDSAFGSVKKSVGLATAALASFGVGFGAAAITKDIISVGASFDTQLSKVKAVSGATAEEFGQLRAEARRLGETTMFTASQAGEGMEYLALAGWEVDAILEAMPGMLNLAAAGALDLGRAADITSDTMQAFGLSADQATHAADVFAYAQANANTNVEMLGDAMTYLAPIANALGWKLEESTAAIMAVSDAGIKGGMAGQAFATSLARLAKPTSGMSKEMKRLGIEFFDAQGQMKSLPDVVKEVEKATNGFSQEQRSAVLTTLFGAQAYKHWAVLLERGSDELNRMTGELINADGAAAGMAATMMDNLGGKWTIFQSQLEGFKLTVFEKIEPLLSKGIDKLSEWFTIAEAGFRLLTGDSEGAQQKLEYFFGTVDGGAEKVANIMSKLESFRDTLKTLKSYVKPTTDVVLALGAGFVTFKASMTGLSIVGTVAKLIKAYRTATLGATLAQMGLNVALLTNPFTWVAVAIAALVAAGIWLWRNWDVVKEKAAQLSAWIAEKWTQLKVWVVNIFTSIGAWIVEKFEQIRAWMSEKVDQAKDAVVWVFTELPLIVAEKLGYMLGVAIEWLSQLPGTFYEWFTGAKESASTAISELPVIIGNFLSNTWDNAVTWLTSIATSFKEWFTEAFNNAVDIVKELPGKVVGFISEIPGKVAGVIGEVWNAFKELGAAIPNAIASGFNAAKDAIGGAAGWAIDKVAGGMSAIGGAFSSGMSAGRGTGHYHGLDNVPYDGYMARLHKGETVLNREEANAYRSRNAGGGGVSVNISGNTFHVRQESDIDAIAYALARKINEAGGLGA